MESKPYLSTPPAHSKSQRRRFETQVMGKPNPIIPEPLQHSKTSINNDNSLKQAERVIATTKSVNEILNEKLKQSEASIGKLKFELSQQKKKAKSDEEYSRNFLKKNIELCQELKDMKLRAETAEKKAVDFDSILKTVRQERDYQVKSYRKFLGLRNILEEYDKLNGLKIGVPDTEKDSEPSK